MASIQETVIQEGKTVQAMGRSMMKVVFPQKYRLDGTLPFNLRFKDSGKRITIWMLSTKICLPEVKYKSDLILYPFYWDCPEVPEWAPRFEFLVGDEEKHGSIHKTWGTQPLNTYLRGHFSLKPQPRAEQVGEHILVQQYFKSGWWGNGKKIIIKEQLQQNKIGFQLLRQLGILKSGVNVFFFDQSKPTQETSGIEYKLFKAEDIPQKYYIWLPNYFRKWRKNDFSKSIEEVIKHNAKYSLS